MNNPTGKNSAENADWIFSSNDTHALPTEKLPGRAQIEQLRQEFNQRQKADTNPEGIPVHAPQPPTSALTPSAEELAVTSVPDQVDAGNGNVFNDPDVVDDEPIDRDRALARSGDTPTDLAPVPRFTVLVAPLKVLSRWDVARDVLAVACVMGVLANNFTWNNTGYQQFPVLITALLALLMVPACYLTWFKVKPLPVKALKYMRLIGGLPLLTVALGYIGWDLATSIPVLFTPISGYPKVGLSAGVALALAGSILLLEQRGHEGFLPEVKHYKRAQNALKVTAGLALCSLIVFIVMTVGRAISGEVSYVIWAWALALLGIVMSAFMFTAGFLRQISWYVFMVALGGLLVIGAIMDNSLRLNFAAPTSFALSFVWLPWFLSAFAIMASRTFLRSVRLTFGRSDWVLYSLRVAEYATVVNAVATLSAGLLIIYALMNGADGHPWVWTFTAVMLLVSTILAFFTQKELLRDPDIARARHLAVIFAVSLMVIGFVTILTHTIATQVAAGALTGGLALEAGLAIFLMIVIPSPVHDEHGAPDMERMYADARRRWVLFAPQQPQLQPLREK